ncbi:MAG: PEP-CTERM sorting domain-containing protein [Akkermansiaceae bacterium]|nr:PEP-CTERM sorting domain-containing protein [Akkermansiaceae bacterium]
MKAPLLLIATLLAPALTTNAATITWDGGGDGVSWTDGNNWSTNNAPTAGDTMNIGGSAIVDFDTTFTSSLSNGSVVINVSSTAQLNLNGGALTFADGNSNTSPINIGDDAVLNITGGTHNLYGRVDIFGGGTIRVTGDDATINLRQLAKSGGASTFEFFFDDTGVSSLDYYSYFNPINQILSVDGSAYTGPYVSSGTQFNLINTTNLSGNEFQAANISIVGLGQEGNTDYGYILTQDQASDDVFITVFVPEPSSTALLGLGLGSLLLRRKRS